MCQIVPSLLVDSREEFERRLRLVERDATLVHVDVLDGTLFPATNWYDAEAVASMKSPAAFELHLMVENPLPILETWRMHVPGLKRAIVHAEIDRPVGAVIREVKNWGLEMGIALNPESPLEEIHEFVRMMDQLTLMGIHPGASGQPFLGASILEKIREVKKRYPDVLVEMDGGATSALIPDLVAAGCDRIVAAHAVFGAQDPAAALASLSRLASSPAA